MLRFLNHIVCWLWIILLVGCQQENPANQSTDKETPAASDVTQPEESSSKSLVESAQGEVVGVYDGDTCTLLVGKEEYKIRLEGIDTPEMDQAFGVQARTFTSLRVSDRQVVVTVHDIDRYGRFVGRVQIDGVDLSVALVSEGLAWHYTRYSDDAVLARAEAEARAKKVGLWSQRSPVPPWEFRRQGRAR